MFVESHYVKGEPEKNSPEKKDKEFISITEAAERSGVSRQAVYVAIQNDKLPAIKQTTRWVIALKDLEEYRKNKYSRKKSTYNGELLFDNDKGYYSINQVAEMLDVKPQKIYYATRAGLIKGSRKGAAWVIHIDEVNAYKKNYLEKTATTFIAG